MLNNKGTVGIATTESKQFSFGRIYLGIDPLYCCARGPSLVISVVDSHELAEVSAYISFRAYNHHFTSPFRSLPFRRVGISYKAMFSILTKTATNLLLLQTRRKVVLQQIRTMSVFNTSRSVHLSLFFSGRSYPANLTTQIGW